MSATTFDRSEPRPVEPSKKAVPSTPVEEVGPPEQAVTSKPFGSVDQPEQGASTPRTPNSKASKTGRSLTKTALDFWEGYLSDGYKLRFTRRSDLLDVLYFKLDDLLIPESPQSPEQQTDTVKRAIERWNLIAEIHDDEQFEAVQRESGHPEASPVGPFATYKDRENNNAADPFPVFGGEVGLTLLFQRSVCALANHFVRQKCFFRDRKPYYTRHLVTSPLVGSGTTDLIGVQACPKVPLGGSPSIRSVIFVHEPFMSLHDVIRLLIELHEGALEVFFKDGKPQWPKTDADSMSAPTRLLLLQIVEQLHINRARYCILSTWDYYLVFHLESQRFISCSDIISRDPAANGETFERRNLIEKARLRRRNISETTWNKIQPGRHNLLQVLVSLMVEQSEDTNQPELWWNKDGSAEKIFNEHSKRQKVSQLFNPDADDPTQNVDPPLNVIAENESDSEHYGRAGPHARSPMSSDPFGGNPTPSSARGAVGETVEDEKDSPDGQDTQQSPMDVEVGMPSPKRIVPFSYDIGDVDHLGHGNYTLPPATTVWYETQYDPEDSCNYFEEYDTQEGGGPNTWPPYPNNVIQDSPPSSPPSLVSDHGSVGSSEAERAGTVVNIVLSEYIASGLSYDAYRGVAEVQYQGHPDLVKIPIVAKYLDCDAEMPKEPGFDIYDSDERFSSYFLEIAILQVLRHSGAVPLFYGKFEDAGASEESRGGGKRWMVMEDCGTPANLFDPEVQSLVREALRVAHNHGIVHDDVQPRHVLWNSERRQAKLIDWGGAQLNYWRNGKADFDRLAMEETHCAERMLGGES